MRSRLGHTWLYDQAGLTLEPWFERLLNDPSIWDRIEAYPWTPALVQCLDVHAPGWKILSVGIHDPYCWSSKVTWVMKRLFPVTDLHRLVLVGGRKYDLAQRGDVLIDDSEDNLSAWQKAGGDVFSWVEFTDDWSEEAAQQIERLRLFLQTRNALRAAGSTLTVGNRDFR